LSALLIREKDKLNMNENKKVYKLDKAGLEVEIGKFARQAHGAAWIKAGDNIVLSTAVASSIPKDFLGFFPLTVEYRERTSSVGKFPGGFFKREGRLSDFEVLGSRLIDRSIRPLFPEFYFNEVQVLSAVHSADGEFPTDILSLIGSSLALTISPIPFNEPIGAVRAHKIDGKWTFNVGLKEDQSADALLTIAGTKSGICMVEGHCDSITEEELIGVLFDAHAEIIGQVDWQSSIAKDLGVVKDEPKSSIDWHGWKEKIAQSLPQDFVRVFYATTKKERSAKNEEMANGILEKFASAIEKSEISKSELLYLYNIVLKSALPDSMAKDNKRIDGRSFDEIRQITTEVGILPRAHGSALFTRGETQALVSLTLGTGQDVQRMEPLHGDMIEKRFMLHYNFTPFSTGEVKMIRGVSRREIGHGYLAESSFYKVLPSKEDFPYTIRSVSDVLESNGSSSMATVCGTTMALMDVGVPIKSMVSGIAMGLIKDSSGTYHILSDILGTEDSIGLMDFKITGTEAGIMAVQMDIKEKTGLSREVLSNALEQARKGRLHILGKMKETLSEPRAKISSRAPRFISFKIAQDKIGAIIGPAGKTIKEIIAQTGVDIDIDDDGMVKIYSYDSDSADKALSFVKGLSGDIEIGTWFTGKVKRHADFGILIDVFPGKTGLLHVSSIDRAKQRDAEEMYPVDSLIKVKVIAFDRDSGRISLMCPELK
jgi:polyribonucleotide nucleotidyltransferase